MKKDINKCEKCGQIFDQVDKKFRKFGHVAFHTVKNDRTGQTWTVCNECKYCSHCKKTPFEIFTNEDNDIWKPNIWLCEECADNATPRKGERERERETKTTEDVKFVAIQAQLL